MSKTAKILIAIPVLAVAAVVFWMSSEKNIQESVSNTDSLWQPQASEPIEEYDLKLDSKTFEDAERKFSFSYPSDFSVSNFPDASGAEVIVVQAPQKGEGFQILISPFDESVSVLTADMIRKDVPGLKITDTQELLIGESGKGVAFLSDNPSFGGSSREVWFTHRGSLYQISTYARLDPLLQAVFGTWKFK